jgi:hypothetical protein
MLPTRDPIRGVTNATYEMRKQGAHRMHESMEQVRSMHPALKHTPVGFPELRKRVG